MKDSVSYIDCLGTGVQPGFTFRQVKGQEFPAVALLTRAAKFPRAQHTFGPFQPIEAALKTARHARGFPRASESMKMPTRFK